ncbi:MAG: integration host factor subunit beta [Gemmataceae bacterium]|nr:integration host factor subunit beta [Gemmataceae bacterium]
MSTLEAFHDGSAHPRPVLQETRHVTKKEIVKQISERAELTQLKTKEIVQWTFDAIVDTLIRDGRIELRNFGVFEVKRRKARKARNPRTGEKVDVEPKNVVTFKPGKEMEERVRRMPSIPSMPVVTGDDEDDDDDLLEEQGNGKKEAVEAGPPRVAKG